MNRSPSNLKAIRAVAHGLKYLLDRVAFVGGSVLDCYADNPFAEEARPTKDVDLVIELAGFAEWAWLQDQLAVLGFIPDSSSTVICRYQFGEYCVDIMSVENSHLGVSNPWYKPGFHCLESVDIDEGLRIRLLPFNYLLATKFAAYQGRGNNEPRTSPDFEDIVYLTYNRLNFVEELSRESNADLKEFLKSQYRAIYQSRYREEWLACHLPFFDRNGLDVVLEKIRRVI